MLGVKISLFLSYLVSIEGFAGLAGLYVLQRKKVQEQQRKKKRTTQLKKRKRAGPTAPEVEVPAATAPGGPERSAEVTGHPEATSANP